MKEGNNPRRKKLIITLVTWGCILILVLAIGITNYLLPFRLLIPAKKIAQRGEGELTLHFLSVGQADCTVIEYPDGGLLVLDGGDGSWQSCNRMIAYLKGLNVKNAPSLSYVVTHADGDHYGGMEELIRLFGGNTLYLPIVGTDEKDYQDLRERAEREGLAIEVLHRYVTIPHPSGAYVSCISPISNETGETNALSSVLYLNYLGKSALFCGDITAEREEKLLTEYTVDQTFFDSENFPVRLSGIDVLKVAHHGSASSSSEAWLNLLQAKYAIVSCGAGNAYRHPTDSALSALKGANEACEIYRTDELGDIVVRINEKEIAVSYGSMES